MDRSKVIFVLAYLLSLPVLWYENKFIVLDYWNRPKFYSHRNQFILWVVRIVLAYGSMAGLFWKYNLIVAGIALIFYWAFGKITGKIYFNREVLAQAPYIAKAMRESALEQRKTINEEEILRESYRLAVQHVEMNLKTGGEEPTPEDYYKYYFQRRD